MILARPDSRLAVKVKRKLNSGPGKCLFDSRHLGFAAREGPVEFLQTANGPRPDTAFLSKSIDGPIQNGSRRPYLNAGQSNASRRGTLIRLRQISRDADPFLDLPAGIYPGCCFRPIQDRRPVRRPQSVLDGETLSRFDGLTPSSTKSLSIVRM